MITCSSCNHQNEIGSSFCENCGHDLREMIPATPVTPIPQAGGGTTCPSCGFSNIPGAAFCENCGTQMGQSIPSAAPIKAPVIPQQPQAPAAGNAGCPACGHQNVPGSVFCENCGGQLGQVAPVAAPIEPPTVQPLVPPVAPPSDVGELCSQCGFSNPHGTLFCGSCGMQIGQAPITPPLEQVVEDVPPVMPPASQLTGRLEIQKSGSSIVIPPGLTEAFIGREDPVSGIFPEIDLDPHGGHDGGVGRKHARLFVQGPQVMIEDLDSVNGTLVNKQKLTPHQPLPVTEGAELRFGKVVTTYHAS